MSEDSCTGPADFLKPFAVSPAQSSVTLPTPVTSCLPVPLTQG